MEYYLFYRHGASGSMAAVRRIFASSEQARHLAERFNRLSHDNKITSVHNALTDRCIWRGLPDDNTL